MTRKFVGNKFIGMEAKNLMGIDHVIQEFFPIDLVDQEKFEDWVSPLRADPFAGAVDLLDSLEKKITSEKTSVEQSTHIHRDYWEIFGGGNSLIKSSSSIRSKIARDLLNGSQKHENTLSRQTEEQLIQRIYGFGDLGRIRIVADFPSDIENLKIKLFDSDLFLGFYICPRGIKDFVFDPKLRQDGLKGHRARQFSVRVPIDHQRDFGFEVQLMTRLQHAWDRRNHPLYEWQRENQDWMEDQEAVELAVDDFACSEALHLVDRQADRNWLRLQDKFKKNQEVSS